MPGELNVFTCNLVTEWAVEGTSSGTETAFGLTDSGKVHGPRGATVNQLSHQFEDFLTWSSDNKKIPRVKGAETLDVALSQAAEWQLAGV